MTLSDYLEQPGSTATDLAGRCGCAVSTITRAAAGKVMPSPALLRRIFTETAGSVTPNDFHDLHDAVDNPEAAESAPGKFDELAGASMDRAA